MTLKYHQPTIDLITQSPFLQAGDLPELSSINTVLLEEKEKLYNIHFPVSIREWFTLNLPSDIAHYEHGTPHARDLKPLSEVIDPDIPQTSNDLWFFLVAEYNRQGGDEIFFQVNGSEDPPIYIDFDDNWDNHRKYGPKFIKINERFSSFIYNHFWDYHKQRLCPYSLYLRNVPELGWELPPNYYVPFSKLRQRYNEISDSLESRFYDEHVCIWAYKLSSGAGEIIFNNEVMNKGWVAADSLEKFDEALNYLWEDDKPTGNFSEGIRLLELRQKNRKK